MAIALSWRGYVDSNLDFSEFFFADHTIIVRFMPQFPNAHGGPWSSEPLALIAS